MENIYKKGIRILNLGCPKNIVDGEILAGVLSRGLDALRVHHDAIIINTCSFIKPARDEAISAIKKAVAEKRLGRVSAVYVTGCMVRSHPGEIEAVRGVDCLVEPVFTWRELFERNEMFTERILSSSPNSAFVRIADGCDNRCSYCLIPEIRGRYRSRKTENIVNEVENLVNKGVKEVVLISEDVGQYGVDIYGKKSLVDLLELLEEIEGLRWVRLLYLNPESIYEELLTTIKRLKKILNYLDLPVQHTEGSVLRKMGRRPLSQSYRKWIEGIYKAVPGIVIRLTFMVGHPGETFDMFKSLMENIKSSPPDHLTAFPYYREDGTASAVMNEQVDEIEKMGRFHRLMSAYYRVGVEKRRQRFVGSVQEAIIESVNVELPYSLGRGSEGRLWFQAPEVDGKILIPGRTSYHSGDIVNILIVGVKGYDFIGRISP